MITEILPEAYDFQGKQTFRPKKKRYGRFSPTFPMGRYVSQPLTVECRTLDDIRDFLKKCRFISDKDQFGKDDYWMPPEEFEERRKGDCDDFALWTWRQLIAIGKTDARFVAGAAGRYGGGHAWTTFQDGGKAYLLEATAPRLAKLPRLETARYIPGISVTWDGEQVRYFEHERRTYRPAFAEALPLFGEWLLFMAGAWVRRARNRLRKVVGTQRAV